MPFLLSIKDLRVAVGDKEIVKGLSLEIPAGEVHALMGPNGSGKSSLVHALMGHPNYAIVAGSVTFEEKDLFAMPPHERAMAGLFLAFQYPREIAGVTLRSFLFAAHKAQATAREEKPLTILQFKDRLDERMRALHMDPAFAERSLNKGFSGGEKKKAEVLQMDILRPRLALLDETDSGLDVDALKIVAEGVQALRSPQSSALVVTHYARILQYLKPDRVHVMINGSIVESGGPELAHALEKDGYKKYVTKKIVLDA